MTDIVKRLRAPHYWMSGSADGHEGENSAPLEAASEIERLREANEMLLTDVRRNDVDAREMMAEIKKLQEERRRVRYVLGAADTLSLPHDYPTERMAADRMSTLKERTLEGLALFGEIEKLRDVDNSWRTMMKETIELRSAVEAKNAKLRAALEDFVNVMDLLSMRVGLTVGEVADHINPVVDKALAALGGDT